MRIMELQALKSAINKDCAGPTRLASQAYKLHNQNEEENLNLNFEKSRFSKFFETLGHDLA